MSDPKLISPLLDNFAMGGAISDHHGISCFPAMENDSDDKYIVKVISVPSSQTKLDALLLTGAYSSVDAALNYFKEVANSVIDEVEILEKLSKLEGFLPFQKHQFVEKEDASGYEIYLLSSYRRTLSRQFSKQPLTHLDVLNLGLDLCAALAVCRRSGYLYVDLKPNNIYVSKDKNYFIGDLGFIPLNSLQYTSLPEKYMSEYTAPEIVDAFSSLNDTLDVYALGLVLYQAYNNGSLPTPNEDGVLPPPQYADYEMAEIIMQALSADPKDRWQDPTQFGQALVGYMQRNGAHDTPIIPPAAPLAETDEQETSVTDEPAQDLYQEEISAEEIADEATVAEEELPTEETEAAEEAIPAEEADVTEEDVSEEETDPASEEVIAEEEPIAETEAVTEESAEDTDVSKEETDEYENMSFLDEEIPQEDLDVSYEEITDEVSNILSQADDLAAHQVPDPVVPPEPIEISIPEPIAVEEPVQEDEAEPTEENASADESTETTDEQETANNTDDEEKPAKKKRGWLTAIIWILVVAGLIVGGGYYYENYYLQTIDSITLEGQEDQLTVTVDTDMDDDALIVVCTDTHGNKFTRELNNGAAKFSELLPNTTYNVSVQPAGFNKLIGRTKTTYSTPIQSKIVQFNAVTGAEEGSAIVSFTVEGPDSEKWNLTYTADGVEEQVSFPGHTVSLSGLTVGKEYTFTLAPQTELYLAGTEEITHTASKLIYAQNVQVVSCADGKLTVQWDNAQDADVANWLVRCNGQDYSQTISATETTATFEGIDPAAAYDVEVLAEGMSVGVKTSITENSITVSNFKVEKTSATELELSWDSNGDVPKNGWVLTTLVDGAEIYSPIISNDNSVSVGSLIPGSTYQFSIQSVDEASVLCAPVTFEMPEAEKFTCNYDGKEITADDITFRMCRRPSSDYWNRYHLYDEDYTTTFQIGQRGAYVMHFEKAYGNSVDDYEITYVVKDVSGIPVSVNSQYTIWNNMWYIYYGHLDVPQMPKTAGEYTIEIYFNGALANSQEFTVE